MIEVGGTPENPVVERAGLLRTARLLFEGYRLRAGEDLAMPAKSAATRPERFPTNRTHSRCP